MTVWRTWTRDLEHGRVSQGQGRKCGCDLGWVLKENDLGIDGNAIAFWNGKQKIDG